MSTKGIYRVPLAAASQTIAQSGTWVSPSLFDAVDASGRKVGVDLRNMDPKGFWSYELQHSGTGTAQLKTLPSVDGTNYAAAVSNSVIATALAEGTNKDAFDVMLCHDLKIEVEEEGVAEIVVDALVIMVQ